MERQQSKKHLWPLLFLSFACFIALVYVLLEFPPGASLQIFTVSISYLPIFFILLFLSLYGLSAFLLRSGLQGILIAGVVICFLIFRLLNVTNLFFTILLLILFLSIEGVVWKRK